MHALIGPIFSKIEKFKKFKNHVKTIIGRHILVDIK